MRVFQMGPKNRPLFVLMSVRIKTVKFREDVSAFVRDQDNCS